MDRPGIGVGVLVMKEGMVLLRKRAESNGNGTWALAGGHIEFGETPEQCAIRETKEEMGLTIESATIVAITNDVFENGKHYVTLWMLAGGIGDEPVTLDSGDPSGHGWFPLDALPSPLFQPIVNLLNGGSLIPFELSSLA